MFGHKLNATRLFVLVIHRTGVTGLMHKSIQAGLKAKGNVETMQHLHLLHSWEKIMAMPNQTICMYSVIHYRKVLDSVTLDPLARVV